MPDEFFALQLFLILGIALYLGWKATRGQHVPLDDDEDGASLL